MHNDEGKLFEVVFHKLLSVGILVFVVAAVVWFAWAMVRLSAITNDAAPATESAEEETSSAPMHNTPLAATQTAPAPTAASAEAMFEWTIQPVATAVGVVDRWLEQMPPRFVSGIRATGFFVDGPF